jgi:hypothetical protein
MATVTEPLTPHWLELASWASQVALVLLAIVAAFAALHQASAFKLFELLKFIQEEGFRNARRRVIVEIGSKRNEPWWDDAPLEAAASTCCAHYDIVGNMLIFSGSRQLTRHFIKHWSDSIVRTYEVLHGFIERRSAAGGNPYSSYRWLYLRALKYKQSVGSAWPPKGEKTQSGAGSGV